MMKNPYRKGTVHPTSPLISAHLSFLPAAILTLTVALTPEDREVLAYLISCYTSYFSGNLSAATRVNTTSITSRNSAEHATSFSCNCFRCYMSYWVRWDSSPNRQLIHEIIDAFEGGLLVQTKKERNNRKERRKNKGSSGSGPHKLKRSESVSVEESSKTSNSGGAEDGDGDDGDEEDFEKGSMRKFVGFLGEKIWSVLA